MNDLISRQATLEALTVTEEMDTAELLWLLTTRINDLPTAEPKRGRWLRDVPPIAWDCSECSAIVCHKTSYCPYCGARMNDPCEDCQEFSCDYCPHCGARMEKNE